MVIFIYHCPIRHSMYLMGQEAKKIKTYIYPRSWFVNLGLFYKILYHIILFMTFNLRKLFKDCNISFKSHKKTKELFQNETRENIRWINPQRGAQFWSMALSVEPDDEQHFLSYDCVTWRTQASRAWLGYIYQGSDRSTFQRVSGGRGASVGPTPPGRR